MERRTLLLIASILVAALGTALIWLYVQGADQRAQQGQSLVQVYVANRAVDTNTPAARVKEQLVRKGFTRESLVGVEGFVTNLDEIDDTFRSKQPLAAGLPVLASQFSAQGGAPEAPVALAANKLAFQVQLGDPQRVAGVLRPGAYVAVFAAAGDPAKPASARAFALLDKVRVLAAEGVTTDAPPARTQGRAARTASEDVPKTSVTLEVTQEQAKKLVLASGEDGTVKTLWFALLGDKAEVTPGIGSGVGMPDLLGVTARTPSDG